MTSPFTPDFFHFLPVKDYNRNGRITFEEVCIFCDLALLLPTRSP